MAARKTSTDWSRIELEYLAGDTSIREIADRHEISEGAIRKRARQAGWVREPRKVRAADRCVPTPAPPPPPSIDPDQPVEAAKIADGGRGLVWRMLEDMIVEATKGDDEDARRTSMLRAVDLGTRANTMKTLALALKTLNEASAPATSKRVYSAYGAAILAAQTEYLPLDRRLNDRA